MNEVQSEVMLISRLPSAVIHNLDLHAGEVFRWLMAASVADSTLHPSEWLLSGASREAATLYAAFSENGLSSEGRAVVREQTKGFLNPITFSIWNGQDDQTGAGLSFEVQPTGFSTFEFSMYDNDKTCRLGNWRTVAKLFELAAEIWKPEIIVFFPDGYPEAKIFQGRPGVGWMLYLPRKLTAKQVPEARALVPVMQDKEQLGTIIVSVTDGVFSMNNPEHVRIANDIEIRLVDQDLLPTFRQIQEAR